MDDRTIQISGEQVREHRRKKGWSQKDLADAAGLSKRTIENIERNRNPSLLNTVHSIAAALEVELLPQSNPGQSAFPPASTSINGPMPTASLWGKWGATLNNAMAIKGLVILLALAVFLMGIFVMQPKFIKSSNVEIINSINEMRDDYIKVAVESKNEILSQVLNVKDKMVEGYNKFKQSISEIKENASYLFKLAKEMKPHIKPLMERAQEKLKDEVVPLKSNPENQGTFASPRK